MGRVTSKLQVTVPKVIATEFGIRPGDEIQWLAAGDSIRVTVTRTPKRPPDLRERLRRFDEAVERQCARERKRPKRPATPRSSGRGWTRDELYDRGQPG